MTDTDIYDKYIKYKKKFYALVRKKLDESIYPQQANDFILRKIPDLHPNAGKNVPIDFYLTNIVTYFWDKGYITVGWDQGWDFGDCAQPCFINFYLKDIHDNDIYIPLTKLLISKFGKNNVVVKSFKSTWTSDDEATKNISKINKYIDAFFHKNPYKIMIKLNKGTDFITLHFRQLIFPKIHNKFNISFPNPKDKLPGGFKLMDIYGKN